MTLVEILERNSREISGKNAIIFRNSVITYGELNEIANSLAHTLRGMGIKKGDRVGLMLPRIPELVIGFLSIAKVQGIAVPINFELPVKAIQTLLVSISARFLIVHSSFLELLEKSLPQDSETLIIVVGNEEREYLSWSNIVREGKRHNPCFEVTDSDIFYLNYTSGSTGNPKGAITTHSNIYWNTLASVDALKLTSEDVHICMFAPFAHPHELFARSLYLGGTLVLVDTLYPKSIAEAISKHQVTCMMGLAPMYENLLNLLDHKPYDLGSLRIPESGGMYTRRELIERFKQKLGVPIIPVWGSTETTGIAIANQPGEPIPPGSVGKPCPSYKIIIVDEDGNELPPGKIGEMLFQGPAVVSGYYENLQNGNTCFKNGWYFSDDLGRKDSEGNFYFVDRKSGMMKVAGLKVYPLEIELVLLEHPDIQEAAVVPAKDRLRGEVPKAILIPKKGRKVTEKDIFSFCKERLPHYKLPRIVEMRDFLPKFGSGKINKKLLNMEYA